jgi:alanine dehydrogenase
MSALIPGTPCIRQRSSEFPGAEILPMIVLSNEDVERLLTLDEALAALRAAFLELHQGHASNRPRNHSYLPVAREGFHDCQYRFKSQEGGNQSAGVWALRVTSEMIGSEVVEGVKRRRYIAAATGNKYCGLVMLFSTAKLEPIAILQDSFIQKMRCSATSALGIDALAPRNARIAGLFGAGWQAQSHLQFMLHVRPDIEQVRVYSPVSEERTHFASHWSRKLGRQVIAVDHPREAVEGCQIITCATNTFAPCFDGNWLEPGTHVTSITHPDAQVVRRELDDTAFDRADVIGVLSRDQIRHDRQVDLLGAIDRGKRRFEDLHELSAILAGAAPRRTRPDQITLFCNNTGMGLQFSAVGARVAELAARHGIGRNIPTDLFLQDTPP